MQQLQTVNLLSLHWSKYASKVDEDRFNSTSYESNREVESLYLRKYLHLLISVYRIYIVFMCFTGFKIMFYFVLRDIPIFEKEWNTIFSCVIQCVKIHIITSAFIVKVI